MNPIALLEKDHREAKDLFKTFEGLGDDALVTKQEIFDKIKTALMIHMAIEEEIFYPAARKAGIDADMLDEADIEHASAKELIAQIEVGNPDDGHYDAKVKVLGEYITHHVVEEHTEMFPKCRRSSMDLVGLRGEMEARKMALVPDGDATATDGRDKGKSTGLLASLFAK